MFRTRMKITSRTCNLSGLRKQPTFRDVVSPITDVFETSTGIIYLWSVLLFFGRCFWSVLPRGKFTLANRGEAVPKPGQWHITSLEFLALLPQTSFLDEASIGVAKFRLFPQATNCQNSYNLDRTRLNWRDLGSRSRQKARRNGEMQVENFPNLGNKLLKTVQNDIWSINITRNN